MSDVVTTAALATGLGVAMSRWPGALQALRYAGAAYLPWMAVGVALMRHSATDDIGVLQMPRRVFWRATINGLLNPKALLFFPTFLPAFVNAANGGVLAQLWVLGLWLTLMAALFHSVLGIVGARLSHAAPLLRSGHAVLHWVQTCVLVALTVWALWI